MIAHTLQCPSFEVSDERGSYCVEGSSSLEVFGLWSFGTSGSIIVVNVPTLEIQVECNILLKHCVRSVGRCSLGPRLPSLLSHGFSRGRGAAWLAIMIDLFAVRSSLGQAEFTSNACETEQSVISFRLNYEATTGRTVVDMCHCCKSFGM